MSKFTSTSINHIKSYSLVSQVINYLATFNLVVAIYGYIQDIAAKALEYAEAYPKVIDALKFADLKFNELVLDTFDYGLSIPIKYYQAALQKFSGVLKQFNSIYLDKVNHYLPGKEVKIADSELSNTYAITSEVVARSKSTVLESYTGASSYVIDTYNSQYSSISGTSEPLKRVSAAYNTTKSVWEDVNSKFVEPFKASTTNYVNDVATQTKSKADSLIKGAKLTKISVEIHTSKPEEKAPIVSATA